MSPCGCAKLARSTDQTPTDSHRDGRLKSRLSTTVLGGEDTMLGNYPIDVVLLAMDLAAAKDFYADKIGLQVLNETDGGVTFQCGGDTRFVVTKSSVGAKDEQTQATFRVADVRAEGSDLRRGGVSDEGY